MAAQIGIPYYRDLVNQKSLSELKKNVTNIVRAYSSFTSSDAIKNRENESFDIYTDQYNKDLVYLKEMIRSAQEIVNSCNDSLYLISGSAMENHIYFYGDSPEENNEKE